MKLSDHELRAILAKPAYAQRNPDEAIVRSVGDQSPWTHPKLEHVVGDDALAKAPAKAKDSGRFFVCFTSVRRVLCDEDNLSEKYLCDLLRYSGIISSDAPDKTSIKTTQRKAEKGEAEHTIITVDYVP